ncbi:hypothetical protein RCL1_005214 [Eukaryota sp. TZLM3-RCL]
MGISSEQQFAGSLSNEPSQKPFYCTTGNGKKTSQPKPLSSSRGCSSVQRIFGSLRSIFQRNFNNQGSQILSPGSESGTNENHNRDIDLQCNGNTASVALKDQSSEQAIYYNIFKNSPIESPHTITEVVVKCSAGMELVDGLATHFPKLQTLTFEKSLRTEVPTDEGDRYKFPEFTDLVLLDIDTSINIDVSKLTSLTSLSVRSHRCIFVSGLHELPLLRKLGLHNVALTDEGIHPFAPLCGRDVDTSSLTRRTTEILEKHYHNN